MKFNGFSIHAQSYIHDAFCQCGSSLTEVSNGFLSAALYCTNCENVYQIVLRKVAAKDVSKAFLTQCRNEVKAKHG